MQMQLLLFQHCKSRLYIVVAVQLGRAHCCFCNSFPLLLYIYKFLPKKWALTLLKKLIVFLMYNWDQWVLWLYLYDGDWKNSWRMNENFYSVACGDCLENQLNNSFLYNVDVSIPEKVKFLSSIWWLPTAVLWLFLSEESVLMLEELQPDIFRRSPFRKLPRLFPWC